MIGKVGDYICKCDGANYKGNSDGPVSGHMGMMMNKFVGAKWE
jgi:hypothetical protein